ncbi:MAG: peptidoglycan-binding protein [Candidatus Omnitrophica bacterium]|nr:peptidoglycan-binding protein [Candidatus Omnitrophota bacterium]
MRSFIFFLICVVFLVSGCGQKKESVEEQPENIQLTEPFEEEITPTTQTQQKVNTTITSVKTQALEKTIPAKPTIKDIQIALKNANLYDGNIDGILGPKTKKAIEEFQAKNDLVVDGKVGPKTWEKLKEYYNKSSTASTNTTITN